MPDSHLQPLTARSLRNGSPKVAVVCHSHPSLTKGGAEIAAYALYRGLQQNGVDVIFICACSRADRYRLAFSDSSEFAVYYDAERYEHFYHLAPRTAEEQLVKIIREQRVDVVSFHHFLNLGVNSLRAVRAIPGLRCYYTIHEFLAICHHHGQMVTRPSQLLCSEATTESCVACYPEYLRTQFAMRKSTLLNAFGDFDGFVSPSRFLAQRYVDWGLAADRMTVIENGLQRATLDARKPKADAVWTFGYFGQINPFKGVDVILEAAELLSTEAAAATRIRIRIHGNFVEQTQSFHDRFAKACKNLSYFFYAGPYNTSSVYRLMGECDYVIVPSKWWENSPVVIQEAYSVNAPVICSGIGGMAEKVEDGVSGLHFKLGDATDLLRIMQFAADAEIAQRLRAGIPAVISASEMARSYSRFFASGKNPVPAEVLVHDRGP